MSDDRPSVLAPATDVLDLDASRPLGPAAPPAPALSPPWYQRRSTLAIAAIAACAIGAGIVSLAVSRLVFPHFSTNNDEPVYVFQARLLLDRRLTLPVTPDTPFFRPWMSGEVDHRLTMVFPPVFPALLALGQALVGSMRAVLAVLSMAAVVLVAALARQLTNDRRAAAIAALLLAACPLFIIQSGLFLSYVLALDLELGAALLLLAGTRTGRLRWFAAGGAVLGVLFFCRPFDAVLVGGPLVVAGLLVGRRGRCRPPPAGDGPAPRCGPDRAGQPRLQRPGDGQPLPAAAGGDRRGQRRRASACDSSRPAARRSPTRGSGPCGPRSATWAPCRAG